MRYLQNLLLTVGATSLGAVSAILVLQFAMRVIFTEPRGENFGGAAIWLGCIFLGGILGAGVGFMTALRRITQHGSSPWSKSIWMGATVGTVVGLLLGAVLFARVYTPFRWFLNALFSAACGLLAGAAARVAERNRVLAKRKK